MTAPRSEPLLVLAGRVHALADDAPARADAVLVRDGRIDAIGSRAALAAAAPRARRLELGAAVLTPGLTDAHVHLVEWALARRQVDLVPARSLDDALARIRHHAAAGPAGWVLGRGWSRDRIGNPPPGALDAAVPDRPAAFQSHDMHSTWANGEALRRAAVGRDTPDPEGGRIVRDGAGEPTGLLLENACALVDRVIPERSVAEVDAAFLDAQGELHRLGLTGVHSVEPDSLRVHERLRAADRLRLRVLQALPLRLLDEAIRLGLRSGFGGEWVRIGGIKLFLDGALGSRTALLREPYEGSADRGIETLSEADFRAAAARCGAAGLALTVHAIGDAAVARALTVLADTPPAAVPHRIEHFQLCPPELVATAARAGIVASMQPAHLITDWRAADRDWGPHRARWSYAFRSLADAGTTLAFGSDVPVEPVDPRLGLYAATARSDLEGNPAGGWYPEEAIDGRAAFLGYTRGPALAAGLRGAAGVLAAGLPADLVAWDRDPLEARGAELLGLRCLATIVGGHVVHHLEPAEPSDG
jgi:predicted amidohydrolase YtcJ